MITTHTDYHSLITRTWATCYMEPYRWIQEMNSNGDLYEISPDDMLVWYVWHDTAERVPLPKNWIVV